MRGFTLPIWVVASAKAAAQVLIGQSFNPNQRIDFSNNDESITVPVRAASSIDNGQKAIGITHCNSGECLDITNGLEIWVCIEYVLKGKFPAVSDAVCTPDSWIQILPGPGVGKLCSTNEISISEFARELLCFNLRPFRKKGYFLNIEIVFPKGKDLAEKTSNHAFGVIDGLALIGTQAEVQVSASPNQLQNSIELLRERCSHKDFSGFLTFVIGENGMNLALEAGLFNHQIIKTGNWLGPLLVAAAQEEVNDLLLFGYHGKLIKLAGGVFHTHHHLADNRLETLISLAVKEELSLSLIKSFQEALTVESALITLENQDSLSAKKLWDRISLEVEKKSMDYVSRYLSSSMEIGAVLFDRERKIRWAGLNGIKKMKSLGFQLED
ncbi:MULTISPECIES: cobalt-precorrin-5B (C(1))-methyltransferase CbiD [unclassified Prochlorococcus]|uniref:cobalt-precorrin-5B (C(1))-methyltransferase CbiD n=1 Tax=unclassified Prochlorococcus TaxID=2627481 RepID=UPI000533A1F5|nr:MULTISPECIES: cobalt-precorrin-5B (C(1))-methyltransferase CbiD [unclassified Prochlorococcus]KGG16914.1 Cobalt-precorrin-6 synthase [Prochlorococcus sp. MIT 0602]KGG18111.1 Cobalt-precorrin-6 synthase [Prochlorococcus sp. MIT 0603]